MVRGVDSNAGRLFVRARSPTDSKTTRIRYYVRPRLGEKEKIRSCYGCKISFPGNVREIVRAGNRDKNRRTREGPFDRADYKRLSYAIRISTFSKIIPIDAPVVFFS